jgi:PAS domain S-box-containing protein
MVPTPLTRDEARRRVIQQREKKVTEELALIVVLSVLVFFLGWCTGIFDWAFQNVDLLKTGKSSIPNVAFGTTLFVCLALMVFSYRRWQESREEARSQKEIAKSLSLLNQEMDARVRQRTAELVKTNRALEAEALERRRAEAVIRQFPAIIESSDDAIISKTIEGIVTSWNPAAEQMFGFTAEEMIGQPITRLFPPDRLQEEEEILAKISRGEKVRHFETVRVRKDGRRIIVSATISPIKDADGKVTGASKIVRDITEHKMAEAARLASEGRYRTLFEYAPVGIIIATPERNCLDANARICQMLGYTHQEMLGRQDTDVLAEQESPHIISALDELHGKQDHQREWQFRRKDGSMFYAEVIATQMPDANILAMVHDISDRKRAAEQISEQAAFLDKARDAILARDLEGNIVFWNNSAERMYGWTRQEVIGRNAGDLFHRDPKEFQELNARVIRLGEWQGELPHFTKHKGELTIEARWTLIRDNAGKPKSVLAINTDITEKKKTEAQVMRAQRMESIGTLAGGIAHDLNNILAPIMMSIDILKDLAKDPESTGILETIEISARRGAEIVRQVLSFARGLESERIEVQPRHLLKDLENIIKDTFPKDIRLQFLIPRDIWTILGDPTQVHQILLNLCVNARDAMRNGGTLAVSVENCLVDEQYAAMTVQATPGRYVIISVTDTGTGIPRELIDKIYDPFFTTKPPNEGTGLGLSTVMGIVKSHDGVINVYSEPGRGTTFKVYLPALEVSGDTHNDKPDTLKMPRGNGEAVLVVDDEASILTITSQTLQTFGYRVLTAANGAAAVATYARRSDEIAVVLTDMMMPVMDGPATIHALLQINPAVKIVAASGLNTNGNEAKVASAGIKHFLTKPYTASTLLKSIRAILDEV